MKIVFFPTILCTCFKFIGAILHDIMEGPMSQFSYLGLSFCSM